MFVSRYVLRGLYDQILFSVSVWLLEFDKHLVLRTETCERNNQWWPE